MKIASCLVFLADVLICGAKTYVQLRVELDNFDDKSVWHAIYVLATQKSTWVGQFNVEYYQLAVILKNLPLLMKINEKQSKWIVQTYNFSKEISQVCEEETIHWNTNQRIKYHEHASQSGTWANVPVAHSATHGKWEEKCMVKAPC